MDYFFILGNHPLLSIAEILAVLPKAYNLRFFGNNSIVLTIDKEFDAVKFLAMIGGTIKVGKIITKLERISEATNKSTEILKDYLPTSGKFSFGISNYGHNGPVVKVVGMTIKNKLREQGISCRWVTSRESALSSVVVEQNKLLSSSGCELVFLTEHKKTFIGVTLAVQPFKNLSLRDYGRPARDDYSGMLPPKLAEMMINLAQIKSSDLLIDPFCGSGTILTEAMFMGFKNIKGSDISTKAINDSELNIVWTAKKYGLKVLPQLKKADAKNLSALYKTNSVDAIVTEVYLGPQRGKIDFKKTSLELENLYNICLKEFYKILKPGKKIVLALPIFRQGNKLNYLALNFNNFKIINSLPRDVVIKEGRTPRHGFIYGREQQKIFREIIVLEK